MNSDSITQMILVYFMKFDYFFLHITLLFTLLEFNYVKPKMFKYEAKKELSH